MTPEQILQIQKVVSGAIEKSVNGKIDKLNTKLDTYIKEDNEWKARANPVIEMGQNITGFGRVALYLMGVVSAIGGIYLFIINLLKK